MPLHKVFSSDYEFQIPDYQRPYAWETEQAIQLLTDLQEARDRGADEPYSSDRLYSSSAAGPHKRTSSTASSASRP